MRLSKYYGLNVNSWLGQASANRTMTGSWCESPSPSVQIFSTIFFPDNILESGPQSAFYALFIGP